MAFSDVYRLQVGLLIRDARRDDRPDATLWSNIERIGTLKRPGASGPDFAIFRAMSIGPAGVSLPSRAR